MRVSKLWGFSPSSPLLHIVLEVLQVCIVLSENHRLAFGTPGPTWCAYGPLLAHQFGDGLRVAHDDHFLAWRQLVYHFRQLRLGFLNRHSTHGAVPYYSAL